ncbi:MAG: LamG-like jellyroll fold domain-containing protein [Flavobacterium sp.]
MKKILLTSIFVLFFITGFSQTVPSYIPTNGLISYWGFESVTNDYTTYANNGTIVGSSSYVSDRFGNNNSAFGFTSNSDIVCTTNSFNNIQVFSISLWFKTQNQGFLFGADNGQCTHSSLWDRYLYIKSNGNLEFYVFSGTQQYCTALGNYKDNFWHNAVAVLSTSGMKLYVDGVLSSQNSTVTSAQNYIGYWRTGGLQSGGNNTVIGNVDDIGLWNRALTQDEVNVLYYGDTTCQALVINTGVLSFNPITYNNTVTIYPNPANTEITIDCGNISNVLGWNIKITNTLGQEMFSAPMNTQQYVVPLNTWTGSGMYFVKIYDSLGNVVNTKKIILQ